MIYRKSALWGQGNVRGQLIDRVMNTLFYNGATHLILRGDIDRQEIADIYYLNLLPWFHIGSRAIESFERAGSLTTIGLEGNSRVEQDWDAKTYTVTVEGNEIARDLATFCPLDATRIAFYSYTERELSAPLPASWKLANPSAVSLSTEKAKPFAIRVEKETIHVQSPARTPIIVYQNEELAQRRLSQF